MLRKPENKDMHGRILVPLDGSKLAEAALPYAEELAGRLGWGIVLLSVAESEIDRDYHWHQIYTEKSIEQIKHEAGKYLEQAKGSSVNVSSEVLVGNPAAEIVAYAEREGMDLIVMATHGRSGISRWALGSVADKVVRAARKPVALIRSNDLRPLVQQKGILDRILVPLDGSSLGETVLPHVERLALALAAEIIFLQIVPGAYRVMADAEGYLNSVSAAMNDRGVAARAMVRNGEPADTIIRVAEENDIDLVAMSTHGRSGVGSWALGSVAGKVLHAGTTPLLLVRSGERK